MTTASPAPTRRRPAWRAARAARRWAPASPPARSRHATAAAVATAAVVAAVAVIAGPARMSAPAAAAGAEAARVDWALPRAVRPGEFEWPQGLAVAPDGTVFVADAGMHRIQRLGPDGAVEAVFGQPGGGEGQLRTPIGLDVAPDGTLWVADSGNGRIAHFDRDGRWLGAWPSARGERWSDPSEPPWVTDVVALLDGTVVVIGEGFGRYSADGRLLERWSTRPPDEAPVDALRALRLPLDPLRATAPLTTWRNLRLFAARAPDGSVWVEGGSGAVRLDARGRIVGRVGGRGTSPGYFYPGIEGVAVDAAGRVHLVDTFLDRVQSFAPDGRFLGWWSIGERGTVDLAVAADGALLLAGGDRGRVDRTSADGRRLGRWGRGWTAGPGGHVAVGPDGRLVVADPEGGRLQVYDDTGRLTALHGTAGDAPGRFERPWGQAFLGDAGTLVVTDAGLDRIAVLEADGDERGRFGEHGAGEASLSGVRGVAVSPSEHRLFIADPGQRRVALGHAYGDLLTVFDVGSIEVLDGDSRFDPVDVAVDAQGAQDLFDERVFIADRAGHRVVQARWRHWGRLWSGGGPDGRWPFDAPEAVALAGRWLFVADTGHDRIQRLATSGAGADDRVFGGPGTAPGTFDRPTGVDVAPDGTVVVHDAGNRRLQRFDGDGGLVDVVPLLDGVQPRAFPPPAPLPDGGFVSTSSDAWRLLTFDAAGRRTGAIALPSPDGAAPWVTALVATADGTIWLADRAHRRIVALAPDGRLLRSMPTPGEADYDAVVTFAVAPDGTVYAHFAYPTRVEVFDPQGRRTAVWPVADQFGRVVIAPDGTLVGADSWPDLPRYRPDGTPLPPLRWPIVVGSPLRDIAVMTEGRYLLSFEDRAVVAASDGLFDITLWRPTEGCARDGGAYGQAAMMTSVVPLAGGSMVAAWSPDCLEGWRAVGEPDAETWRVALHPDAHAAEPPVIVTDTARADLAWPAGAVRPAALARAPGLRHLPPGGGSATLDRVVALDAPATLHLDVAATGGLRLWLDDRLVIDAPLVRPPGDPWPARSTSTVRPAAAPIAATHAIAVAAGRHRLRAVYQADGTAAQVRLDVALGPPPTASPPAPSPSPPPVPSPGRVWLPWAGR